MYVCLCMVQKHTCPLMLFWLDTHKYIIISTFDIALRWTAPNVQFSPVLYKDCVIVKLGFKVYIVFKACLYRWVLSNDLNLVRLSHVLICSGRKFHVFGAAFFEWSHSKCFIFDFWYFQYRADCVWLHVILCWLSDGDELLEVSWGCLVDAFKCE